LPSLVILRTHAADMRRLSLILVLTLSVVNGTSLWSSFFGGGSANDAPEPDERAEQLIASLAEDDDDVVEEVVVPRKPSLIDLSEHGIPRFEDESEEGDESEEYVTITPTATSSSSSATTASPRDLLEFFGPDVDPLQVLQSKEASFPPHWFPQVPFTEYVQATRDALRRINVRQVIEALHEPDDEFNMQHFYEEYELEWLKMIEQNAKTYKESTEQSKIEDEDEGEEDENLKTEEDKKAAESDSDDSDDGEGGYFKIIASKSS
jgi:hypothetical protein